MKTKYLSLFLVALVLAVTTSNALAGLILDGRVWEVRGSIGGWSSQQSQAAADTGWTWASSSDWVATGLDVQPISDPDWSALMGDLDGTPVFPNAWLSDLPVSIPSPSALILLASDRASEPDGKLYFGPIDPNLQAYRMSYREAAAPVPTTASLLGLSLALMGWLRRKRAR